jgi:hypothetical protein
MKLPVYIVRHVDGHYSMYNKAFHDRDIICVDNGIYKKLEEILNNLALKCNKQIEKNGYP